MRLKDQLRKRPVAGVIAIVAFFILQSLLTILFEQMFGPEKMQRWLCLAVDWPQRGLLIARRCRQEPRHADRRAEPRRSERRIHLLRPARPGIAATRRR